MGVWRSGERCCIDILQNVRFKQSYFSNLVLLVETSVLLCVILLFFSLMVGSKEFPPLPVLPEEKLVSPSIRFYQLYNILLLQVYKPIFIFILEELRLYIQ